jgi:hypothetical protein
MYFFQNIIVTKAPHTKVMAFGNGRLPQNLSFSYDNLNLEIVKNFNYLGIIFTRTGNFSLTKKHLADKALTAMYEVLKMGRMHKLSIKCLPISKHHYFGFICIYF